MTLWNELVAVANDCSQYDCVQKGMVSSMASNRSCANCSHLKNSKCELNLYDKILAGQDEY